MIVEVVTGVDAAALAKAPRLELLDSALHSPQAGFGNEDFYPSVMHKAAVLACGSREIILCLTPTNGSWQPLTEFLALNGHDLRVNVEDAVAFMRGVAAGEIDEEAAADWIVADAGAGPLTSMFTADVYVSARGRDHPSDTSFRAPGSWTPTR